MIFPDDRHERELAALGCRFVAGLDEAGRGPLAGPVVAAAVILGDWRHERINDSKKLTPKAREFLFDEIRAHAVAHAVAIVDVAAIDRINILEASRLAMRQALAGLSPAADGVLADAMVLGTGFPERSLIHGDALSVSIAAASILAKVTRDRLMLDYDAVWPEYGFAAHKGYGTARHMAALAGHGPCPIHRKSFTPVRNLIK